MNGAETKIILEFIFHLLMSVTRGNDGLCLGPMRGLAEQAGIDELETSKISL